MAGASPWSGWESKVVAWPAERASQLAVGSSPRTAWRYPRSQYATGREWRVASTWCPWTSVIAPPLPSRRVESPGIVPRAGAGCSSRRRSAGPGYQTPPAALLLAPAVVVPHQRERRGRLERPPSPPPPALGLLAPLPSGARAPGRPVPTPPRLGWGGGCGEGEESA